MAIKSVGNQQVYVIEAQPVAAARTSTGVGYANLVSQLRWQIWEEAQKAVEQQMGYEKLGYQAQLEAYSKQRAQLQNSILKIKTLKDKVASGELTMAQAASLAKADASFEQGEANRALKTAVRKTERTSTKETIIGDEKSQSKSQSALYDQQGNPIKKGSAGKKPSERLAELTGRLGIEGDTEADTADTDTYLQSLEAELAALEIPNINFDTNALSRTRETFGGMAGVGGFGFMPRPSKTSPIYDEARIRERISAAQPAEQAAIRANADMAYAAKEAALLAPRRDRRLSRISELETLASLETAPEIKEKLTAQIESLKAQSDALTPVEQQALRSSAAAEATTELGQSLLQAGRGSRTEPQFMSKYEAPSPLPTSRPAPRDRDILSRMGESFVGVPGVDAAGFQYGGQGPVTTAVPSPAAPQPLPSAQPTPDMPVAPAPVLEAPVTSQPVRRNRDLDILAKMGESFAMPGVDASGLQYGGQGPSVAPVEPPVAAQRMPTVSKAPEASTKDEDTKRADASTDLYTFYAPRSIDLDTNEEKLVPLNNLEKKKIFDMWMAEEETTSVMTDEEGKAWYREAIKKVKEPDERGGKAEPKTRQQRSAAYALGIVQAGKQLADKPAKLARLAKLDLPEKERMTKVPEHILLVDKIYNVNRPRQDAYKSTYNEISRVYAKDEKRKKEALQYLSAKQILESEA